MRRRGEGRWNSGEAAAEKGAAGDEGREKEEGGAADEKFCGVL
jgi:hypothetical protein